MLIEPRAHRIILANGKACDMLGYPRGDLQGRICIDTICPLHQDRCPITNHLDHLDNFECRLTTRSCQPVPVLMSVTGIHFDGRRHLLETFIDLTARKAFSHPDAAEMSPSDINVAIRSTATVSRNEWKYVADLELDLDDELPMVPCVLGELNQAMLNMVVNAAQAIGEQGQTTPERRGKIAIATRATRDHVEIRIADGGPGIAENVRERVFEPSFTTKEVGKGTGQGSSIARHVVVDLEALTMQCSLNCLDDANLVVHINTCAPIAPSLVMSHSVSSHAVRRRSGNSYGSRSRRPSVARSIQTGSRSRSFAEDADDRPPPRQWPPASPTSPANRL